MGHLQKKVAYLSGLMDGLEVEGGSKEAKVLAGIVDVLNEMAEAIDSIEDAQEELEEYVESIENDLCELEEDYYGEDQDSEDEADYIQVVCPNCNETVFFEEEVLDDDSVELTCPSCGETINPEEDTLVIYDDKDALASEKNKPEDEN